MYADGDEVGNHTYTHSPSFEDDSDRAFGMELSATQRIIQGATGHSATLFRFPYESLSVADPLVAHASSLGYQVVGWGTDTSDWQRPGVAAIVDSALDDPEGNVILMHDGGGDRSETVAALPLILEALQQHHLRAVSLGAAMGLTRAQAMPAAGLGELLLGWALVGAAWSVDHALLILQTVIESALLLVFGRLFVLGLLGPVHALRHRRPHGRPYRGPVSVVIAAHNEEAVIARTLEAVLDSRYPGRLEVLVVDDGSTDGTATVVRTFAGPRARLLRQPQSGKSIALQRAFGRARHPVVVTLDADTLFTPTTIRELVEPLGDPRVAAVSGNIKVGNRVNWLTRLQGFEYTLTLNLERRAYALLNCVPIVPGAIGGWRRDAVLALGGFTTDTLAEDTDMTLALRGAGHRIVYAARAVAFTEAPQDLRGLIRQRTRWSFGTLQCLWKHRRATFNPRTGTLGLVALPGMWLSQLVLPALSPIVDVGLMMSPLTPWRDRILVATAAYNLLLILLGGWALAADREPIRRACLIPVQNLVYRQFTYVMAMRAAVQALRGARVGWHRVVRLGTAVTGDRREAPPRTALGIASVHLELELVAAGDASSRRPAAR
jgi:peptidoglycan-N-acetylglucosamine deacetylase